ncbi:MAG: M56 family metallopeptidase, partial [Planctomycetaceae bacterium]
MSPQAILQQLGTTLGWVAVFGVVVGVIAVALNQLVRHSPQLRYVVSLFAQTALLFSLPVVFVLVHSQSVGSFSTPEQVSVIAPENSPPPAEVTPIASEVAPLGPSELITDEGASEFHPSLDVESDARASLESESASAMGSWVEESERLEVELVKQIEWPVWIAAFYCCGVLLMALRLCAAVIGSHRLRRCCKVVTPLVTASLERQAKRLGLARLPAVRLCDRLAVPVVVGAIRPLIMLPASVVTGLSTSELESVLLHELAHIRRFDHLLIVVQRLAETVLFFHPVTWYLSRVLNTERENCCDDIVLAAGVSRCAYASLLCKIAESTLPTTTATTVAINGGKPSQLRRRVGRILQVPPKRTRFSVAFPFTVGLLVLLSATVTAGVLVFEQTSPARTVDENELDSVSIVRPDQRATFVEDALDRVVAIPQDGCTVEQAIRSVGKQTRLEIECSDSAVESLSKRWRKAVPGLTSVARVVLQSIVENNGLLYETLSGCVVIHRNRIRGTVTDNAGSPLAGVTVCVRLHTPNSALRSSVYRSRLNLPPEIEGSVVTGSNGQFEITATPNPGFRYLLWCFDETHGLSVSPLHTYSPDGTAELRFHSFASKLQLETGKAFRHTFWEGKFEQSAQSFERPLATSRTRLAEGIRTFPTRVFLRPQLTRKEMEERIAERFSGSVRPSAMMSDDDLSDGSRVALSPFEVARVPAAIRERMAVETTDEGSSQFRSVYPFESLGVETLSGFVREGATRRNGSVTVQKAMPFSGQVDGFAALPKVVRQSATVTLRSWKKRLAFETVVPIADDGSFSTQIAATYSIDVAADFCDGTDYILSGPLRMTVAVRRKLKLWVDPRVRLKGKVRSADGVPVAGAELVVSGARKAGAFSSLMFSSKRFLGERSVTVRTDDAGEFIAMAPPTGIRVYVQSLVDGEQTIPAFYANGSSGWKPSIEDGVAEYPTIELTKPTSISGRLIDTNDRPV